jgi:hypothetical protein
LLVPARLLQRLAHQTASTAPCSHPPKPPFRPCPHPPKLPPACTSRLACPVPACSAPDSPPQCSSRTASGSAAPAQFTSCLV